MPEMDVSKPLQGQTDESAETSIGAPQPSDPLMALGTAAGQGTLPFSPLVQRQIAENAAQASQTQQAAQPLAGETPGIDGKLPMHRQLMQAADKLGLAPGPMGWARSLVAAAQNTLSGLGDIAQAGRDLRPGEGGIQAIMETFAAQKQAKQQKQMFAAKLDQEKALTMEANIRMMHEKELMHQLGEQTSAASLKRDTEQFNSTRAQPGTQVVATNVSGDEMTRLMQSGRFKPDEMTYFHTGDTTVLDSSGEEHHVARFSITTLPKQHTITEDELKWLHVVPGYEDAKAGFTTTGAQANMLHQNAMDRLAANSAADKMMEDHDIETRHRKMVTQYKPEWLSALAAAGGNMEIALHAMQENGFTKKYPDFLQGLEEDYDKKGGPGTFQKILDENAKVRNDMKLKQIELMEKDPLYKFTHDPSALSGEHATSAVAQLEGMLKEEKDLERKRLTTSALATARTARDMYAEDKRIQTQTMESVKQGDPKLAAQELVRGDVTLQSLRTRGVNEDFITHTIDEAHKLDNTYNPQQEIAAAQVASSPQRSAFFTNVNSILDPTGTAKQIVDAYNQLGAHRIPAYNKIDQWRQAELGGGAPAAFASTVIGLADDYAKVQTGAAATDVSAARILEAINAAHSPEGFAAAVNGVIRATKSQRQAGVGNNRFLKRMYETPAVTEVTVKDGKLSFTEGGATPGVPPNASHIYRDPKTKAVVGYALDGNYVSLGGK